MFANKVVIVTGGNGGIGAGAAESFAKEGASLAIVGRNEAKLKTVAERCEKLGVPVLPIKADVSKDEDAKSVIKQTIERFGKIDVLVNNAGILKFATILDSNVLDVYDDTMNVNLRPVILLTHLAAPYLKETKGNVVNVSSIAGFKVMAPGMGLYCISKAGMDQFTRAAALELAPFGVRVNSINPGPVETEILSNYEEQEGNLSEVAALGRVSDVTETGDLIAYLASHKARGITGSTYVLDNGVLLK